MPSRRRAPEPPATPRPRRRAGRPPRLLEPDLEKRLLDTIRSGVPVRHAANFCGIDERTIYRWIERGQAADQAAADGQPPDPDTEVYRQFCLSLSRARAEAAARNMALLQQAARGGALVRRTTRTYRDGSRDVQEDFAPPDWRAAAWFLERSFPHEFGRAAQQIEVSGPGGGPVQIEDAGRAAVLAERLARVAEERGELEAGEAAAPAEPDAS